MAKFNYRQLSDHDKRALIGDLLEILHRAKNKDILDKLLLQLLTPSEIVMVARRWQIAKRLAADQSYYKMGVSS